MSDTPEEDQADKTSYLTDVRLDEETLVHTNADIEHERKVAIFDLLEHNHFAPNDIPSGPYHLCLSIVEKRLLFDIRSEDGTALRQILLSLTPFRRIIKDYFMMCESYHDAIRSASPSQIEAIDMGRRGLHNEGAEILRDRLDGKIEMDFDTTRRLFTLITVLHIKV